MKERKSLHQYFEEWVDICIILCIPKSFSEVENYILLKRPKLQKSTKTCSILQCIVVQFSLVQCCQVYCSIHGESGEGLWLQGLEAFETHSFRDTESQPVIPLNEKRIIKCLPSIQTRPKLSVPPLLTFTFLAQHSNAVLSVTVNLDQEQLLYNLLHTL